MNRREKAIHEKEFKQILNNDITKEWIIQRAKKNNKWKTIDQILETVKKENPAFAGYIQEEIIEKEKPSNQAA